MSQSTVSSQLPYASSTPLPSSRNELSLSFSNLSEIFDEGTSALAKRLNKNALSGRFASENVLPQLFNNLNISKDSKETSIISRSCDDQVSTSSPKKPKNARKGQDWNLFKPKKMEGIYNSLLMNQNYKKEVHDWINHFQQDKDSAVINMLQFLIDICGYQDIDSTSFWIPTQYDVLALKSYMEQNPPKVQLETGKYLFKSTSCWAVQTQSLINEFIQYFMEVAYEEGLNFEELMVIFAVLIGFSTSTNRSMLHTSINLIIKLNTIILTIQSKTKLNAYSNIFKYLLSNFSLIIETNCNLQDHQLDLMKIVCAEEMPLWFYLDPLLIAKSKYFNRLMRLVQNQSKGVRQAALKTCYHLITTERLNEHLKPFIEVFGKVVGGRVCDIDYGIATSAIKIYTILLDKYYDAVEEVVRNKIIYLMCGKHSLLAMAAGEFFVTYTKKVKREDSFMVSLLYYVYLAKRTDYITFVVESLLDCCPELSDWPQMIEYLLDDNMELNSELRTLLICIMSESVQQSHAGKSKIYRMKTYERQFKLPSNEITTMFIGKMAKLLKMYKKDSLGIQKLLEILLIMNLEEVALTKDSPEIDNILMTLRPIFAEQTDKDTLETISKYLSLMCGHNISLLNKYEGKIKTLKLACRDAVSNHIKQLNAEQAEIWMLRCLMLATYHDLSEVMPFQFFMESFEVLKQNEFTSNAIEYALKCCHQTLKWQLKNITDNALDSIDLESLNDEVAVTKNSFDKFTDYCFKIMTENKEHHLNFAAFECICEVYLQFKYDLERPSKTNNILSVLIPVIENQNRIRLFIHTMHVVLFEGTIKATLRLRRCLVDKVFDLMILNVMPLTESTQLLQNYHSHYEEYGYIFEAKLKSIHDVNALTYSTIITLSLMYKYSQYLLIKNGLTEDMVNSLHKLAKQFQLLLNRSASDSLKLLNLGVKYVMLSERNYMFLDIIKIFSKSLSQKDKADLINSVLTKTPEENKENEYIKKFVYYLQNKSFLKRTAVEMDTSISTVTESGSPESYRIEDSSTEAT